MVVADSPPLYGGRSAPLPRGRPRFTSGTSNSLPRHPTRGQSAHHSRMVRQCISGACHARRVWAPRPTLGPHSSARPLFTWEPSPSPLSPSHSPQTLLSLAKPWRSSPSSSLAIEALPRRSITRERQGTMPASYTAPISSSSLGRSFPQQVLLLLHLLLQAPRKEDDPELLQAFPVALKPLPVSYSTPVSVSPPRSIPHFPRI